MTDAIRPSPPLAALRTAPETKLRVLAQQLEAGFLAEMLGHAGFGAARESFGGGAGEEQFTSFLRQEQARALAQAGGVGLAEALFRAMSRGDDAKRGA